MGEPVSKSNFHSALARSSQRLTKPTAQPSLRQPTAAAIPTAAPRIDWGEGVDVSAFYGRASELVTLNQWIVGDRCRMIALLGMGGIGKTALSVKVWRYAL